MCFAGMKGERDAISGMMAAFDVAQYTSLRLNLQPLQLPPHGSGYVVRRNFSLLSFSPPSSLVSLGASVLLYFSRDVFKYNAVIVGLPIIPFLPVHPSSVTQQVEDLHFVVSRSQACQVL